MGRTKKGKPSVKNSVKSQQLTSVENRLETASLNDMEEAPMQKKKKLSISTKTVSLPGKLGKRKIKDPHLSRRKPRLHQQNLLKETK